MVAIRWLAALPCLAIVFGTAWVNRVEPLIFGMPLVLAWVAGWVVIGVVVMALVYWLDPVRSDGAGR